RLRFIIDTGATGGVRLRHTSRHKSCRMLAWGRRSHDWRDRNENHAGARSTERETGMITEALKTQLRAARHIAVITGAGISAESGIPTFRDAQTGLWARYSPEQLATPEAFLSDPVLVWD